MHNLFRNLAVSFFLASSLFAAQRGQFESLYKADAPAGSIKIMNLNCCWLFDTEDDPAIEEDQNHKPADYQVKLNGISEAIKRNDPDVLSLEEVENRKVLEDLVKTTGKEYKILHFDGKDSFTGQDVALLYKPEKLEESRPLQTNLDLGADLLDDEGNVIVKAQTLSKGLLETELQIKATGEKIVFLVTHLKAQPGGWASDLKRIAQANTIRSRMDVIFNTINKKIILLGDLNDFPHSPTIEQLTGEAQYIYDFDSTNMNLFYDVFVDYPLQENFTFIAKKFLKAGGKMRYMGTAYSRLDYVIASGWVRGRLVEPYIDTNFDILKKWPTDHYALVVRLDPRTASPAPAPSEQGFAFDEQESED